MTGTITIEIPWPPSLNGMYANRAGWVRGANGTVKRAAKGRCPTARYVAWRKAMDTTLMAARVKPVAGPVAVRLQLHPADNRRRDGDNLSKPVLDALVRMRIIPDDDRKTVVETSVRWGEKRKPALALITITPAGD